MNQHDAFPFIGAGYANFHNWVGIDVRFVTPPNDDQIKKICKLAPPPIKPHPRDFNGRMLHAYSSGYNLLQTNIQETYDPVFTASKTSLIIFEADIERWLLEIHVFCPIELVYRMEIEEAGGTQLSNWHYNSLKDIPGLLQKWEQDPGTYQQNEKELEQFRLAVKAIFHYGQVDLETLSETLTEYLFPEWLLEKLFDNPDSSKALAFYRKHSKNEQVNRSAEQLVKNLHAQKEYAKLNRLTEGTLDSNAPDYSFMWPHIDKIAFAAIMENDQPLIDRLVQQLSNRQYGSTSSSGDCASCEYASKIGAYAYTFHHKNNKDAFIQARRLYEIALAIQPPEPCTISLKLYCNALWILQHDNTGLPVDPVLNEKFLAKCLPYAPGNPAIFHNALCLYVEMNAFDKALHCYKQAIHYKYNGIQLMKDQIRSEKVFADFKNYPPLKR
jgi:tetratricopeptide (TPR) repeat protein